MESYAFVGEAAPTPVPGTSWRRRIGLACLGVVGIAIALGAALLGTIITPFHYADTLAVFSLAVGPAVIVLTIFAARDGRLPSNLTLKQMLAAAAIGFAAIVMVPAHGLLYANERWDDSPAVIETVPVVDTFTRSSRSTTTYWVSVATDVPSPLGRWSFYTTQPIAVSRTQWQRIVPGQTRLVLREHGGFFRLPWFERTPTILY